MGLKGQNKRTDRLKKQGGQLVLEYVLLMLVAVSMATVAKNAIIGEPTTPGDCESARVLSRMVCGITYDIAQDIPGE